MMARAGASIRSWPSALGAAAWIGACLAGSYTAMGYDFRAGWLGARLAAWPADSMLSRPEGRPVVVAFVHPRCVCTRATIAQLIRTVSESPRSALLVPVFVPPDRADEAAWLGAESVRAVRRALPQAQVWPDPGGREAARFGAFTSGTVVVFDAAGRERFRGGITGSRGNDGDNPGRQSFAASLRAARAPAWTSMPVFGCPLTSEPDEPSGAPST